MGNEATVLGFVGLPYTLATYLVEGKSSKVTHLIGGLTCSFADLLTGGQANG